MATQITENHTNIDTHTHPYTHICTEKKQYDQAPSSDPEALTYIVSMNTQCLSVSQVQKLTLKTEDGMYNLTSWHQECCLCFPSPRTD